MPPISIDSIDCVRTWRPLAVSDTSIPLACQKRVFRAYVLVVGRPHEYLDRQELAILVELVRGDLPTCSRRKEYGVPVSSDPRSGVLRMKKRPGTSPVTIGSAFERDKVAFLSFDVPISRPMIGTGDKRTKTGYVGARNPWAHDPELGVFNQEVFGLRRHLRFR